MLTRNKVAAVLTAIALSVSTLAVSQPASAAQTATCSKISKWYPNGVAVSKWKVRDGSDGPILKPKVRSSVYKKYSYLDYDRDGIICEVIHYELPDYVELVVSPTVNKKLLDREIQNMARMLFTIKDYFSPNKITAVIHTEKDAVWGDKKILELGGSTPGAISSQVPTKRGADCGFAGASLDKNNDLIFYACTNSNGYRSKPDQAIIPHEVWHLVHFELAKGTLPLWWTEGAAGHFGWAYAFPGYKKTALEEAGGSWRFDSTKAGMPAGIEYKKAMANITVQQMSILMDAFDNDNRWMDRELYAHYSVGQVAVRLITDRFGEAGVVEFYSKTDPNAGPHGWRNTFAEVFGMSVEEFYVILTKEMNTLFKAYK